MKKYLRLKVINIIFKEGKRVCVCYLVNRSKCMSNIKDPKKDLGKKIGRKLIYI